MSRKGKKPRASPRRDAADVWQAGVVRFPGWLADEDSVPVRPWVTLVADRRRKLILAHKLEPRHPGVVAIWSVIKSAMKSPLSGPARRPQAVEIAAGAPYAADLARRLSAAGIAGILSSSLEALDEVSAALLSGVGDRGAAWALTEIRGLSREALAGFYEAAAGFHELAPWDLVPSDAPLRIDCPGLGNGPWYAVVIGQEGTPGLAVYKDLDLLRSLILDGRGDEETALRTTGTSLIYSEAHEISVRDLEAAEALGWRVDGEGAYPLVIQMTAGEPPRCPTAAELKELEGCLVGYARFIQRGLERIRGREPSRIEGEDMQFRWEPV